MGKMEEGGGMKNEKYKMSRKFGICRMGNHDGDFVAPPKAMLIVLSPAKTLDETPVKPVIPTTAPVLMEDSALLAAKLKTYTPARLKKLMDISPELAALNHARYQSGRMRLLQNRPRSCSTARPAAGLGRGKRSMPPICVSHSATCAF